VNLRCRQRSERVTSSLTFSRNPRNQSTFDHRRMSEHRALYKRLGIAQRSQRRKNRARLTRLVNLCDSSREAPIITGADGLVNSREPRLLIDSRGNRRQCNWHRSRLIKSPLPSNEISRTPLNRKRTRSISAIDARTHTAGIVPEKLEMETERERERERERSQSLI